MWIKLSAGFAFSGALSRCTFGGPNLAAEGGLP